MDARELVAKGRAAGSAEPGATLMAGLKHRECMETFDWPGIPPPGLLESYYATYSAG